MEWGVYLVSLFILELLDFLQGLCRRPAISPDYWRGREYARFGVHTTYRHGGYEVSFITSVLV